MTVLETRSSYVVMQRHLMLGILDLSGIKVHANVMQSEGVVILRCINMSQIVILGHD